MAELACWLTNSGRLNHKVVTRPASTTTTSTTHIDILCVYVVGDFNVHLDRDDDPNIVQFTELLTHLLWVFRSSDYSHSQHHVSNVEQL